MQLAKFLEETLQLKDQALIGDALRVADQISIKRGELLFREGEPPTHMCILMRGILRGFLLDVDGKDITECILFRGGTSVMPEDDITMPASSNIQALTDCEVFRIPVTEVFRLLNVYPEVVELSKRLFLQASHLHRTAQIAAYRYTAVQRYQWFLKEYPGVIDQISHKYVASYLNMTPVTLSRVRAVANARAAGEDGPPEPHSDGQ